MSEYTNKILEKNIKVRFISNEKVLVNNQPHSILINKTKDDIYKVFYKNKYFLCKLLKSNDNKFEIFLNNHRFSVECKTGLEILTEELESKKSGTDKDKIEVFSPMPGLILKILKSNGEFVKQGEPVMILEAMKMENEITSPSDGELIFGNIKQGETIEKNVKLFEINSLLFQKNC